MPYLDNPPMAQLDSWGNCGSTCQNIIELLAAKKKDLNLVVKYKGQLEYIGKKIGEAELVQLRHRLVTPVDGQYTLLDVAFLGSHEFMLDIRPDGSCSLVNGYQPVYSALWWCGTSKRGESANHLGSARAWGAGQDIGKDKLAARVVKFLSCKTWGGTRQSGKGIPVGASGSWQKLPFSPADPAALAFEKSDADIGLWVTTYQVTGDIAGALAALKVEQDPAPNFLSVALVRSEVARLGVRDPWFAA